MTKRQETSVRGLLGFAGYVPYRRLERSAIAAVAGGGGGRGQRSVASYDEDSTTMAAEAARLALRAAPGPAVGRLLFATSSPAYADRTNATAVHAVLGLDAAAPAMDAAGSVRAATGLLRLALESGPAAGAAPGCTLVAAGDIRTGRPGGPDESAGGDGGSALLIGGEADGPLLAAYLGGATVTAEFTDRWRAPGERHSSLWEERFGEQRYLAAGRRAWQDALKATGLTADQVDRVLVTGLHARAVAGLRRSLGVPDGALADGLEALTGVTGAAHPGLLLARELERFAAGPAGSGPAGSGPAGSGPAGSGAGPAGSGAGPAGSGAGPAGSGAAPADRVLALVLLADGADVLLFRTTPALAAHRPARSVDAQIATGGAIPYGRFLAWRGELRPEPPRRPEPARTSSSAAARSVEWKYGFTGSRDRSSGAVHLPPQRVSMRGDAQDEMDPAPMAEAAGTVRTFTVDRMAWSPSPPVVLAVVDFDGGGRLPVELTDVDAGQVAIGDRVEPAFRRLGSADGIVNYFWKARPIRAAETPAED
ncbi:OB-fold domain-containing protein [Phaeacidiphilus oryzae]|uniref:OB-fold domain-containing protein n=1 Tax=Phaeacidiphilus oryzae TaxID=348818 RepID=UPI00055C5316|nr:OB-fold domain-containing protein [Phaeacidiphilus oryzae]